MKVSPTPTSSQLVPGAAEGPPAPHGPPPTGGADGHPAPVRTSHCELAERLIDSYGQDGAMRVAPGHELPEAEAVRGALQLLRALLFPGYAGQARPAGTTLLSHVEALLSQLRVALSQQVYRGLHHRCPAPGAHCAPCERHGNDVTERFLSELPVLRHRLLKDVRAAYDGDPAATGTDEVVFSYPGLKAVTVYRIAHALHRLGAVIVPRMMTEQAHAETGVDIHPGARIGESFFIDHGTGVVIGETTDIGDRVRVYQGVTLGALSLTRGRQGPAGGGKRHPTIEDDVIIYANATILGGDTVIGRGAVIGGNTWVTTSVPPGMKVTTPCH